MKFSVTVKPGSHQDEVTVEGDQILLRTRAKAHDGEANEAVVKILSKHFHVGKTCIQIVSGATSKHKIVEVIGLD